MVYQFVFGNLVKKKHMKLYHKQDEHNLYDTFSISLELPSIKSIKEKDRALYDDFTKGFIVKFNTGVYYHTSNIHWFIEVTVLGFGFSVFRQTGY